MEFVPASLPSLRNGKVGLKWHDEPTFVNLAVQFRSIEDGYVLYSIRLLLRMVQGIIEAGGDAGVNDDLIHTDL